MRVVRAVVIGFTLCGCATPPVAGASTSRAEPSGDPASPALTDARQRRDSAAHLAPPSLPAGATPPAVVSFMKDPVAQWVKARRAAVDACTEAYRSAVKDAPPPERAAALLEASQAALAFLDAYGQVSNDVATVLATDPEMKSELLAAFRESERPHIEMATNLLEECVQTDERADSGAAAECRRLLANVSRGSEGR